MRSKALGQSFSLICLITTTLLLLLSQLAVAIELTDGHNSKKQPSFKQAIDTGLLMAKIEILLVEKNTQRVIPPKYNLKSGDKIRLRIRSTLNGYASLNIIGEKKHQLNAQLKSNMPLLLPTVKEGLLELDHKPGTEWLQLVISTDRHSRLSPRHKADKYPNGKIKQIILRNIKLKPASGQQVSFDTTEQAIYFSSDNPNTRSISLNIGLSHDL